ncbi:hypothetical protein [Micromonospora sp. SH-82]|uniref:hypothetical protein n=1 Tax=Micromonospora sp. SH-82 TaxID=3132938 RepID=UPI003EB991F5
MNPDDSRKSEWEQVSPTLWARSGPDDTVMRSRNPYMTGHEAMLQLWAEAHPAEQVVERVQESIREAAGHLIGAGGHLEQARAQIKTASDCYEFLVMAPGDALSRRGALQATDMTVSSFTDGMRGIDEAQWRLRGAAILAAQLDERLRSHPRSVTADQPMTEEVFQGMAANLSAARKELPAPLESDGLTDLRKARRDFAEATRPDARVVLDVLKEVTSRTGQMSVAVELTMSSLRDLKRSGESWDTPLSTIDAGTAWQARSDRVAGVVDAVRREFSNGVWTPTQNANDRKANRQMAAAVGRILHGVDRSEHGLYWKATHAQLQHQPETFPSVDLRGPDPELTRMAGFRLTGIGSRPPFTGSPAPTAPQRPHGNHNGSAPGSPTPRGRTT